MASEKNVFIFNNIEHNQKDIVNLHETFSSIGCVVGYVRTDKYAECIERIKHGNFAKFKFIVIAVLDDKNEDERYFSSSDGKKIELYTDILEAVYMNASLHKKLCLFLLQINRNYSTAPPERQNRGLLRASTHDYVMYFATSAGCYLDKRSWDSTGESFFIRILCEEIRMNAERQQPVVAMLNTVTGRINLETNDCPSLSKNISVSSYCIP